MALGLWGQFGIIRFYQSSEVPVMSKVVIKVQVHEGKFIRVANKTGKDTSQSDCQEVENRPGTQWGKWRLKSSKADPWTRRDRAYPQWKMETRIIRRGEQFLSQCSPTYSQWYDAVKKAKAYSCVIICR